jgi:hypothetical protein
MKLFRSLAVLVIAGLICGPAVIALAAPAAIAAPAVATTLSRASATSAVEPLHANALPAVNSHCPRRPDKFTIYYDGCAKWIAFNCVTGHKFNISPPDYASSDCPQAINLWTGAGETGQPICIGPDGYTGFLSTKYHSFNIKDGGTC